MIIKSKFKDYYDCIAHCYGGGDPSVVYPRYRIGELTKDHIDLGIRVSVDEFNIPCLPRTYGDASYYQFKYCAVAGKYYLMVSPAQTFPRYEILTSSHPVFDLVYGRYERRGFKLGVEDEGLVRLSREIKAPVFMLDGGGSYDYYNRNYSTAKIDCTVPILADMGFPKLISAAQMYQDIAYFMGNKINESPDLAPPPKPPMTDKERILSHGFDMKQSFRHRK